MSAARGKDLEGGGGANGFPQVAKALVSVERKKFLLFSRKRAPGTDKHGRLELLGGHMDGGESPLEALVRELAEEEATGTLATRVRKSKPSSTAIPLSDAVYHVFRIGISLDDYLTLEPGHGESLGFHLVPLSLMTKRRLRSHFTDKTVELFTSMGILD